MNEVKPISALDWLRDLPRSRCALCRQIQDGCGHHELMNEQEEELNAIE